MAVPNSQARLNRWIALLGVTALTVYLSWKVLEPFVEVLILGIALTVIFQPVHQRFAGWTGGNRLAAVFSTLAVLLVLIVPFTFVSITLVNEVGPAIKQLEGGYNSVMDAVDRNILKEDPKPEDSVKADPDSTDVPPEVEVKSEAPKTEDPNAAVAEAKPKAPAQPEGRLARLMREWKVDRILTREKVDAWMEQAPGFVAANAYRVGSGVVGFLLGFVFLIFVLFFLFRDGHKLLPRLINMLPMPHEQAVALVRRTEEVLGGCVYGVLMVAAVQGTLGGITFWALGLGSPVTWGLVMTLLCTLPIVGAWVVWVPAAIGLAIHGDYTKAIILAAIGQFVISTIDGFLRPIFVGQRAKMHELVIFFSVLGGLKYFGLIGILLGPIVMSLAWSLTSVLWQDQNVAKTATGPVPPA